MIYKTTDHIPALCTRYTMFWALYLISIALMTIGIIIEICTGDLFTSTIMLICMVTSIACATFVFRR